MTPVEMRAAAGLSLEARKDRPLGTAPQFPPRLSSRPPQHSSWTLLLITFTLTVFFLLPEDKLPRPSLI